MLLELESFEPVFADPEESPEDALARVKPLLALVIDGALDAARSDLFIARATRRGVRVILFSSPGSAADVQALAESRGLDWLTLPVDGRRLANVLGRATGPARRKRDRRVRSSPTMAPGGGLLYRDGSGRTWRVYDRRAGPRRSSDPSGSSSADGHAYRVFINEQGEEWRFPFTGDRPLGVTVAALERQLAKAVLHREKS